MKEILYGTNEKEPQTEAVAQLAQELYNSGLLGILIADLQLIDFEVRLGPFMEVRLTEKFHTYMLNMFLLGQTFVYISFLTTRVRKTWLRSSTTSSGVRLVPGRLRWSTSALSRTSSSCCLEGKKTHTHTHDFSHAANDD